MKRHGNLWPQVICFEALLHAAEQACKGKRFRPAVAAWRARLRRPTVWAPPTSPVRTDMPSIRSNSQKTITEAISSSTATAPAKPQSSASSICEMMIWAIIVSRRLPSSVGVTKKPSAVMNTSRPAAATPGSDCGK